MKEMVLKYGDPGSCKAFNFNGIKKKFIHNHSMNQTPVRKRDRG